jgi:hypothetical protein
MDQYTQDLEFLRTLDPATHVVGGLDLGDALGEMSPAKIISILVAAGVAAAVMYVKFFRSSVDEPVYEPLEHLDDEHSEPRDVNQEFNDHLDKIDKVSSNELDGLYKSLGHQKEELIGVDHEFTVSYLIPDKIRIKINVTSAKIKLAEHDLNRIKQDEQRTLQNLYGISIPNNRVITWNKQRSDDLSQVIEFYSKIFKYVEFVTKTKLKAEEYRKDDYLRWADTELKRIDDRVVEPESWPKLFSEEEKQLLLANSAASDWLIKSKLKPDYGQEGDGDGDSDGEHFGWSEYQAALKGVTERLLDSSERDVDGSKSQYIEIARTTESNELRDRWLRSRNQSPDVEAEAVREFTRLLDNIDASKTEELIHAERVFNNVQQTNGINYLVADAHKNWALHKNKMVQRSRQIWISERYKVPIPTNRKIDPFGDGSDKRALYNFYKELSRANASAPKIPKLLTDDDKQWLIDNGYITPAVVGGLGYQIYIGMTVTLLIIAILLILYTIYSVVRVCVRHPSGGYHGIARVCSS